MLKKLCRTVQRYHQHSVESKKAFDQPIVKNKIILWSYRGRSYACNPKYITEYMLNNGFAEDYDIVWCFKNPQEYETLRKRGVRTVSYYSAEFFAELATAHFVITNTRFGLDFHKRKGQIYIQTWHGTMALKMIEKDAEKTLNKGYLVNAINDSKKTDYILSGCRKNTDIIRRAFWYSGPVLEIGNPRNDIFFRGEEWKERVLNNYHVTGKNIILYAPTFRSNGRTDVYDLDFVSIIKVMEKKLGGEFLVLYRLHPNLKGKKIISARGDNIIDVTDYDDMQELLAACDVLITDFSSSMFDMCLMKKICFLYASDYDQYIQSERGLYFDIEKDMPFPLAKSNEEMVRLIESFNEKKYYRQMNDFYKELGFVEKGNAAGELFEVMKRHM